MPQKDAGYTFNGIIPMRKESMFEEEAFPPEESESTYVNYETYKKLISQIDPVLQELKHAYRDFQAIDFLIDRVDLEYFMIQPVCLFKGITCPAMSKKVRDFRDILRIFVEAKEQNKTVVLYELIYFPVYMEFYDIDKKTFNKTARENPIETESCWLFRYGVVDQP